MKKDIKKIIPLSENYEVKIQDKYIIIKKGDHEIKIPYKIKKFKPKMEGNSIVLEKKSGNKTDKKRIHALHSHLNNAINGLEKKYEYRLQICSIHFPMNVKVEKDKFVVKNFFGERKERILTIKPNVSLKVENDIVTVTSPDKNLAGEQASEIEALTKVTSRDRRVFQDGIWIIKKSKGRKNGED